MKTKKEELNLFNLVWIGFTFIAGITFTASFADILNTQNDSSVGYHIFWIFVLEGLIAFLCAWSFAKLVKIHPQANGGGSQYARTAFGKFWGLIVGLLNYSVIPVIGIALMVTMIRANFDNLAGYNNGEWGQWGSFGGLYLDLISYGLYIFAASIILFGLKKYKIIATIIGYITWGITIILIIFGLIVGFVQPLNEINNTGFVAQITDIRLGFNNFANTFITCFFAFAGIETFITTGKNIKNRRKNMPCAIIIIMILTTIFYILFTALVMFAVRQENWSSNPNTQIFSGYSSVWLQQFGSWLIIICTIFMRFNSSIQVTLFGGSTIEPLASQKFLPEVLNKENKENIPVAGIFVTIVAITITFIMFVLVPGLIQGFTNRPSPFNYATLASVASILLISIYFIIIIAALTHGFKKNMKVKLWEYIGWFLTLGFIVFILYMYLWGLISIFIDPYDANGMFDIQSFIMAIFQIIYISAILIAAILSYFLYHKKCIKNLNDEQSKNYEQVLKLYTIIKE